jgi:hypothetical protein
MFRSTARTIDVSRAPKVQGPSVATPPRRPGSMRRTSSIDMRWPGGWGTQMRLVGRARDLLTPLDGPARVLAQDEVRVGVGPDRTIQDIETVPSRAGVAALVGARGGGRLRALLGDVVPAERDAGTPLYLLLDDLSGATLIGGFAYSQWPDQWPADWIAERGRRASQRRMEGVCIGFQPGSSALAPDGTSRFSHDIRAVQPLPDPADPIGWHDLEHVTDVSMRRARRIDVHLGDVIEIDAMFQDSATVPAGGRVAVHEYRVEATADPITGALLSVTADPRVLPYRECPLAALNVGRMVGTPLSELRANVLERLKGVDGCTHLNDALRALAEVPILVAPLRDTGRSDDAG